jgi:hypothetical protein
MGDTSRPRLAARLAAGQRRRRVEPEQQLAERACRSRQPFVRAVQHVPLADDGKAFHGQNNQAAGQQLEFDGLRRHHAQAQPGAHRLLQRLVGAELAPRPVGHVLRCEVALHRGPRA